MRQSDMKREVRDPLPHGRPPQHDCRLLALAVWAVGLVWNGLGIPAIAIAQGTARSVPSSQWGSSALAVALFLILWMAFRWGFTRLLTLQKNMTEVQRMLVDAIKRMELGQDEMNTSRDAIARSLHEVISRLNDRVHVLEDGRERA